MLPFYREFLFRVSYLEIYNEQINDLLCPASTMANVRILESKKLGVQLQGVKEEVVISPQQVYALISAGEAQRHVGSTDANKVCEDKTARVDWLKSNLIWRIYPPAARPSNIFLYLLL